MVLSDCSFTILERDGGKRGRCGKNGALHRWVLNEGKEVKLERMPLGLGEYIDGQWEESPHKALGSVLEKIKENSVLSALS